MSTGTTDLEAGLITSQGPHSPSKPTNSSSAAPLDAIFTHHGVRVRLRLTDDGLEWEPVGKTTNCCSPCKGKVVAGKVHIEDLIAAEADTTLTRWNDVLLKLTGALDVYTYGHNRKRYQELFPKRLRFKTDKEDVEEWAAAIRAKIEAIEQRPRKLLVFVNPFGGKRQAPLVWKLHMEPMMKLAGIECQLVHTDSAGHAERVVTGMSLEDARSCDGIVAVGGDGLFHEVVNGLLTLRAEREGSELADQAALMRLGHVPAGSTDTVAYTLHGTRSVQTAVLRLLLGDDIALDIARLDMLQSRTHTFAVSMIAYGYMGDLMKESEAWRCMGPLRYEYVGAKVLFRSRMYSAKVSYLPAAAANLEDATLQHDLHKEQGMCLANCLHCAAATTAGEAKGAAKFSQRARRVSLLSGQERLGWEIVEGEFRSIMVVVIPCRSNKSQHGVIPGSHLADGVMHLVMVGACSNLQYLRFLLGINQQGLQDGMFDFVKMVPIKAVQVRPTEGKRQSYWNCDGELLPENHISVRAHQGLVRVFGVDHRSGDD